MQPAPGSTGRTADHDLAAARAELDRVVEQVDEHLPKACLVAPSAWQPLRDVDAQRHALPLGKEAQPFGRGRCQPSEIEIVDEREACAALDPREIHDLADHLDEVAGLDLDLGDPVAHLRGDRLAGRVCVAAEGLGQQPDRRQRRPQLVRQVVDELGPDLLKPAELADVREHEPYAARGRTPGADEQRRTVGAAQADLAGGVALLECRPGERLDLRIEEHLQEVQAQQRPWRPIDERVRRTVRVRRPPAGGRGRRPPCPRDRRGTGGPAPGRRGRARAGRCPRGAARHRRPGRPRARPPTALAPSAGWRPPGDARGTRRRTRSPARSR